MTPVEKKRSASEKRSMNRPRVIVPGIGEESPAKPVKMNARKRIAQKKIGKVK